MTNVTNKYAILIGINGYHESLGRLKYCVNDVRRLADVLTQGEDAFPKDRLLVLTDDGEQERCPTYANIHSWLASYLAQAEDDDTVFVYFAGHGREHGGKAYLLPSDATLQTVHVTGIPVSYVQELLERCNARQKVLVLDACHSGAGRDVAAMSAGILNELSAGKGIYTITSCDASELSHEWTDRKQGVFSFFLAEALSGGCVPDAKGRITIDSVYEYVYDKVRSWARRNRCAQSPKRFQHGSGVIALQHAAPDWKEIAGRLERQLKRTEKELEDAREQLDEERARAEGITRLRQAVRDFVTENEGKWSKREWQETRKTLRSRFSSLSMKSSDFDDLLAEERSQWLGDQQEDAASKQAGVGLQIHNLQRSLDKAKEENSGLRARLQPVARKRRLALYLIGALALVAVGFCMWTFRAALPIVGPHILGGYRQQYEAAKQWADSGDYRRAYEVGMQLEAKLRAAYTPEMQDLRRAVTAEMGTRILPAYYGGEYDAMIAKATAKNIEAAYVRGQALLTALLHHKDPALGSLREQVRSKLDGEISPAYYEAKGFWIEGSKLMAWDATGRQVKVIAAFKSIDQFLLSPDKTKIACAVNGQDEVYVVDIDGANLSRVTYGGRNYELNGWTGADALSYAYSPPGYSGHRDALIRINEANSPMNK